MELGAVLPHHEIGADPGAIRAYVQGVEGLGLTHLVVYDHVLGAVRDRPGGFEGPYDAEVGFHEPLTFFAWVAALTERVEMVTTVMILPQRQAVLVAKQAAEVAILSDNRLRLGVGTGWNKVEYDALNETFTNRGARQEEQVELMRRLWTEGTLTFRGRYHTVEAAGIKPRPTRPVPVWFGGTAPAALERAARLGQGFMPLGGANEGTAAQLDTIRRHREAAGRTMEGFGIQAQAQYAGGTTERWQKQAERWRALGATHLALATHNAAPTDADGHLARLAEWQAAVTA